jgi:hypothetical protein
MKRFIVPVIVGIISSIIPLKLGYGAESWEYWWISLPIIIMSFIVTPIHNRILYGNDIKKLKKIKNVRNKEDS